MYNEYFFKKPINVDKKMIIKYNENMNNLLGVDRVAFKIFGVEVYWYGIIICIAIIVAIVAACILAKKKGESADMALNIALVILPTGILGGRLFSVIFEDGLQISDFFNFRTGGMSIIGAIIGGGLGLLIFLLIKKEKDKLKYFDLLVTVLILAQAIGRWGNFFNGEVYGQTLSDNAIFNFFPFAVEIDGVKYQALFFYESVLDLLGFTYLCQIYTGMNKSGYATAFYLIYYGVIRTILECFRNEQYVLKLLGVPVSQVCSVIMILFGLLIFIYLMIKNKKQRTARNGKEI